MAYGVKAFLRGVCGGGGSLGLESLVWLLIVLIQM